MTVAALWIALSSVSGCSSESAPAPTSESKDLTELKQKLDARRAQQYEQNKAACVDSLGKAECQKQGYVFK